MAASSSYSNPIFRSGEDRRHSNLNNVQDIALPIRRGAQVATVLANREIFFVFAPKTVRVLVRPEFAFPV
jgi:hypothetical protein